MLAIGFDTSTPNVGVAVVDDASGLLARSDEVSANRPGEQLAPAVAALLAQAGARPADLDTVGVGLGPGPFTGLRVGIVFAAVLGHALEIPVFGCCSLDALAHPHLAGGSGDVVAITDARRREVHWARYSAEGARTDGPHVDLPAVLAASLRPEDRLVGAGAVQHQDLMPTEAAGPPLFPDAEWIAALALRRHSAGEQPEPLTPLYLRRPDAAETFTAKSVLT